MQPKTKEVLTLKANGLMTKQVSSKLAIHRRTVDWHIAKACEELGAKNTVHAVAIAIKKGLILASEIGCIVLLCGLSMMNNVDARRGPIVRNMARTARREVIV